MSGVFLALLCAQCFAALSLGAELWYFHRRASKSTLYLRSRSSSTIEKPEISSKKRCLKVDLFIPNDHRTLALLKELELLHCDAKLRILQLENKQKFDYDE